MSKEKMNNEKSLETSKSAKKKEKGASLVEYAILVGLIAVVCIVAVKVIGQKASKNFSDIASAL